MVAKENFFFGLPRTAAVMFRASTLASRKACCAVGGKYFPVLESGTSAQSPSAHTFGHSGTSRVASTQTRPRSFLHGSEASRGLGEVPAVQINILEARRVPSLNVTDSSETAVTLTFTRTSTPRSPSFFCA